jgi:putative nucleotidyltransferase with HDIG domain
MGLLYRVEQFWQLVRATPLPPTAWQEIEGILTPAELSLFRRYTVADRRHAYRVFRTLRRAGQEQTALLRAALLHDVGKTCYRLHLWERVAGALAELVSPARVKRWGQGPVSGWRRAFVIRNQHAEWGAEMAESAGSTAMVVTLIRQHQEKEGMPSDPEVNELLQQLQWADDQN